MESSFVALGFYKNEPRYFAVDQRGRVFASTNLSDAAEFSTVEVAAVAALTLEVRTKLAHCRAVVKSEAASARPI